MSDIRVRFAPSPTGYLHVGGARTAIYNWLFAKATGGKFILRIEDTDRKRYNEEALHDLIRDLRWMGLQWDEGHEAGGDFGPYQQSDRLEIYKKEVFNLVQSGHAYPCFCTEERLESLRAEQKDSQNDFGYDRHCRDLDPVVAQQRIEAGEKFVVRFKTPLDGATVFNDLLRGEITYQNNTLDDLVLLKRDGYPTYHMASIVDDHSMKITHVLRGDEWIASTPKHVLLYAAFGWTPPIFCHLPVILAAGGGKLSKRKGAASVGDFRDLGYLPEALFNYLALLGWSPGDNREEMSLAEMAEAFTLERIGSSAVSFDEKKLLWLNSQHLAKKTPLEIMPYFKSVALQNGLDLQKTSETDLLKILSLVIPRARLTLDIFDIARPFFEAPKAYDDKLVRKIWNPAAAEVLQKLVDVLKSLSSFGVQDLEASFESVAQVLDLKPGSFNQSVRLAVSGAGGGPSLFEMLELLGQQESVTRINQAVDFINGLK
jgi:glutamyl-tRNA synthetase